MNLPSSGLCSSSRPQSENQRKQKVKQLLPSVQRTKKTMEHELEDNTNCNWRIWKDHQKFVKGTERNGNRWTNQDNPNYSIGEIG